MSATVMRYSRSGLLFTACREAIVLVAYPDGKHLSIGMGSNSPSLKDGDTITVHEAFERFKEDIAARELIVNRALKVEISQQIFDAVVDFYYQNGNKPDSQGRRGFIELMKLINTGSLNEAADYLLDCHRNSTGEPVAGLLRRREMERNIWISADYGDLSTVKLWRGNPHTTKPELYKIQLNDL